MSCSSNVSSLALQWHKSAMCMFNVFRVVVDNHGGLGYCGFHCEFYHVSDTCGVFP